MISKEKIHAFFRIVDSELREPAHVILTGAAAGLFWGQRRASEDVDFQLKQLGDFDWERVDQAIRKACSKTGLKANYSSDIDRWGMISLLDYEKHAKVYREFGSLKLLLMDPVYWSIGKITRYLEADRADVAAVFKKIQPPLEHVKAIWKRALDESPKSEVLFRFKRNAKNFLEEYGKDIWPG